MPAGRPTKYRPEFAEQAYRLALLRYTDLEIAEQFEVDPRQIARWKRSKLQFRRSLARGRAEADGNVALSLYQRAVGFTGPDGRYYPGDVNAASLWLRNRQPHLWRDKVEHEHSGTVEQQISLMPIEERLAKARELMEFGKAYLPLLARQRAEEEARMLLEHQQADDTDGEEGTAEAVSATPNENFKSVR